MAKIEVLVRQATREDIVAIVRLLADDQLGRSREELSEPLAESYYAAWEAINASSRDWLMIAEQAGQLVGTLHLTLIPSLTYQGGWRANIEAVHVAAEARNQGIGQQLIEWAVNHAQQYNCVFVQLTTNVQRLDAHRFYQRLGFVPSHVGMKRYLKEDSNEP